jgi:WS/DGAT/MGAT family acyltransferase
MPELNKRLTALDTTFLTFERKESPLHIGSSHIFEGEIPFEDFVKNVEGKLPLIPRYRQKVIPAPFNVGYPTWEFDRNFNIRNHIIRVELPKPGTLAQFKEMSQSLQEPMLSRDKPLWELYLVYGLEGGNSGLVAKVHHCMVDGMSGIDLAKIMFDLSPNPAPPPPTQPDPIEPKVDFTRRYVDGLLDSMESGVKSWFDFQTNLLNFGQNLMKETPDTLMRRMNTVAPSLATPVPLLPFNRPPSGKQAFSWTEIIFAEARAIRAAIGGTVNDVVLTVLSGAIPRFVEHLGQKVEGKKMRIMVPVSMRQEDQRGALGNLVSVMPTELPMDIHDPLARYKYVNSKTGELKGTRVAEGLNVFSTLLGAVPASVQVMAGMLAPTSVPVFNIVATNVPGPQIPLYAQGKKMIAYFPYVPIAFAVGLSCAILSYDQKLTFGITLDGSFARETDTLTQIMHETFAELRQAAGVAEIKAPVAKPTGAKETGSAATNGTSRKAKAEKATVSSN